MFTTWVDGGGNLIAFRPDSSSRPCWASRRSTGQRWPNGYLKVDTTRRPGAGITDQTIQFHGDGRPLHARRGPCRRHALLQRDRGDHATPRSRCVSVGTSGGQAAAFTYDLPQSIVYPRQGNPAWAGQERDATGPIRSDDLYFGGSSHRLGRT